VAQEIVYTGEPPQFVDPQLMQVWAYVTTLDPLDEKRDVVVVNNLSAEWQERYREVFFWRFHRLRTKNEIDFHMSVKDFEQVAKLAVEYFRFETMENVAMQLFYRDIREKFKQWDKTQLGLRVNTEKDGRQQPVDVWKVVWVPPPNEAGTKDTLVDIIKANPEQVRIMTDPSLRTG